MSKLPITIATSEYDHITDLMTGRVQVEGLDINYLNFEIEEIFYRFVLNREWEVSEMSLAKFVAQVSGDRPDILGLPVFPSRVFRLSNIYIRKDSQIKELKDLRGKKMGTPEWAQTASVYTRGVLVDEGVTQGAPVREPVRRQEAQGEREAGARREQRCLAVPREDQGDHHDLEDQRQVAGPVELLGDRRLAPAEVVEQVDGAAGGEEPPGQHQPPVVAHRRENSRSTYQNIVITEAKSCTAAPTYASSGKRRRMFWVW